MATLESYGRKNSSIQRPSSHVSSHLAVPSLPNVYRLLCWGLRPMCRHGFTTGSSPFGEEKKVMKWLQHKMLSDVTEGDTKPYASPKEANTWLCWVGVGGEDGVMISGFLPVISPLMHLHYQVGHIRRTGQTDDAETTWTKQASHFELTDSSF